MQFSILHIRMKLKYLLIFFLSFSNYKFYSQKLRTRDEIIKELNKVKEDTNKVNLLIELSVSWDFSDHGKSFNSASEALALAEKIGFRKGIAEALNNMGSASAALSEYTQALHYYKRLQDSAIKWNIPYYKMTASINSANLYRNKGEFSKAATLYFEALKWSDAEKNILFRAITENNLGMLYERQGKMDEALQYYLKSMESHRLNGDTTEYSKPLLDIGNVYAQTGKFKEALPYYERGYKLNLFLNKKDGVSSALNNMAIVHFELGDKNKSLEYFRRALQFDIEMNEIDGVCNSYSNLSNYYLQTNDINKAILMADSALIIALKHRILPCIKNAYSLLADISYTQKQFEQAFNYSKLYSDYKDSVLNESSLKQLGQLQSFYQAEKKEQELLMKEKEHEKDVAEIKSQNAWKITFATGFVLMLLSAFLILRGYRQKQKANAELTEKNDIIIKQSQYTEKQKHIIEEKQKEILDSINYAKRIQYTLLAHEDFLKENLPAHFTYFNPKDIVSGDFYWAAKHNGKFYLAVCDSTGHGVPGAFMSLLNIGFLSEAINEKGIEKPNEIFDYVRLKLTNTISKEGQKDGFDGILICVDAVSKQITYAAANNAPILIAGASTGSATAQFIELEADRMPVGVGERKENFKLYTIDANHGDMLYLYTDGYADQFGGPKGKKFKYKQLNELLLANYTKPLNEQHTVLKSTFENWQGDLEQVDDVCVIGIRI